MSPRLRFSPLSFLLVLIYLVFEHVFIVFWYLNLFDACIIVSLLCLIFTGFLFTVLVCLCVVFLVFGTLFLFSGTFLGYFYIGFVCFCMFLGDLYGVFFEC